RHCHSEGRVFCGLKDLNQSALLGAPAEEFLLLGRQLPVIVFSYFDFRFSIFDFRFSNSNSKETPMSNVRSTSLCTFTFSDGRRCRTLRQSGHPLFCSFHARRQDRSNSAETLGREFAHFFSGKYLSACDLNTALAKLF